METVISVLLGVVIGIPLGWIILYRSVLVLAGKYPEPFIKLIDKLYEASHE